MNNVHPHPITTRTGERDRGSILAIAMVVVVVFSTVAVAVASYSTASLRASAVTKTRVAALAAAEGGMRIALEDIRLPRAVGDGKTTSGSTTVTSASAGFRADDVGKGIEGAGIPAGSTIVSVTNATTVAISDAATITASNVYVAYGNAICGASTGTILNTTINGSAVSVKCIRQPSVPGEFGSPALVITGSDGLELKEDTNYIYGDVYFTQPSTISLGKKLIVEDGNIWYPAASCPTTKPSIAKLTIERPDAFTYSCVATSASDKYSDLFPNPVVSAVPALAPASKKVGSCQVFYPGRYTTTNKPDLDGTKETYFKSGLYYFDNVGEIKIKDTIITAGQPGESEVADADESLWNPNCKNAATGASVNDTGKGVTLVLGGDSRIKMEDKGGLELYAPNNGYSIVAYATATNGYAASSGGTTSDPLIDQEDDQTALRVHGNVWAPGGSVVLGRPTEATYTDGGAIATGGQLLGGAVLKWLQLDKKPATDGYNLQADVPSTQYRVLVVATAGNQVVRAVADVRPSGEELALRSWQTSGTATIATPSTPTLVTKPALGTGSDTGTLDDNTTSKSKPTFTGSAAPGATVKLYADGTLVGSGIAAGSGTYTITPTSALTEGEHALVATATNSAGDTSESLAAGFTIDLTPPTITAADIVVAPIANTTVGGFVKPGGQYYVYANAIDTSSIASVTANVSALTTGSSAVALTSGDYTMATVAYAFRGGPFTASASLTPGAKTVTATATDNAGNAAVSPNATVTVDNAAPAALVTSPAAGTTLTLSQTVTATVTDAPAGVESVDFQVAAGGTGSWSSIGVDTTAPYSVVWDTSLLLAATYDIRVVALDNAANSATSATVTVNMRPPNQPSAPTVHSSSDTGKQGDNKTQDQTPTVTGTATVGTTVKVYDGATLRGTVAVAADGTYTVTLSSMSQGSHTMTATATSPGGLISDPSPPSTFVIDTSDPVIATSNIKIAPIDNTSVGSYAKPGVSYYIYANPTDAGSGVWTVTADASTVTTGASAVTLVAGSWPFAGVTYTHRSDALVANNPLTNGDKDIDVTVVDEVGRDKEATEKVKIETTNPAGPITSPAANAVVPRSTTIVAAPTDNNVVASVKFEWSASGLNSWNLITLRTAAPWTATWDTTLLTNGGTYDLQVTTTDGAGNSVVTTRTVTVDNVIPAAPSTPVLAPASDTGKVGDNKTKNTLPTFTGTAEADSNVKLYDGATLIGSGNAAGGVWSITSTVALANGAHTITATATDLGGNVSPASGSVVVTVDATVPTISNVSLANSTGTIGRVDTGDSVTINYSEPLLASSMCTAWTDDTIVQTVVDATVTIRNAGGRDQVEVTSPTCPGGFAFGVIDTRKDYVNSHPTFTASSVSWNPTTFTVTITLGTWDGTGTLATGVGADKPRITPTATVTDIAGNAPSLSEWADPDNSRF